MYVLTIDQRGSQHSRDLVPEFLALLGDVPSVMAFERSVGDEVQGVFDDPDAVVEVALRALRADHWYVGIGLGGVDLPLPTSPREASGTAFVAARRAVDRAKKTGERVPLSVQSGPGRPTTPKASSAGVTTSGHDPVAAAEAVLVLTGNLVRNRSAAEWRVLDQLTPGVRGQQTAVAKALEISPQAVSSAIFRAGWQEEQGGRAAAALLLGLANEHAEMSVPGITL